MTKRGLHEPPIRLLQPNTTTKAPANSKSHPTNPITLSQLITGWGSPSTSFHLQRLGGVQPVTVRSPMILFCVFLYVLAWITTSLDFMEYGVDGRFLCRHDCSILQRERNIRVVRLEDAHHLTRVEDCNRILPGDVMAIKLLLHQWRIG